MRVEFHVFRGTLISWQDLFTQAAEFAESIGPDRLISISHSSDHSDGIVTVWYWSAERGSSGTTRGAPQATRHRS